MSDVGLTSNPDPPDDGMYETADCTHEVYEGEILIYWKDTKGAIKSLCPDCFMDKVKEMTVEELARKFDCEFTTVGE